jgi:hypothetical protein
MAPEGEAQLEEDAIRLREELIALTEEVDRVLVSSLSTALRDLDGLRAKRERLRSRYNRFVFETEQSYPSPYAAPRTVYMSKVEERGEGRRLGHWAVGSLMVMMQTWADVGTAIDRKTAHAMAEDARRWAVISMWVAAISLVASLFSFGLTLLP